MAPGSFSNSTSNISDLISEFRDFKINVLEGNLTFQSLRVKNNFEDFSEKLDFISDTFSNDIVSGSLALNLLGLLTRKSNDIDIVIDDRKRFPSYARGDYDDEFTTPNRLGIREFKYKKNFLTKEKSFEVDFFENKEATFLTFDYNRKKLKIHNPIEIMQHKLEIIQNKMVVASTLRKHNEDLTQIFGLAPWQLALKYERK